MLDVFCVYLNYIILNEEEEWKGMKSRVLVFVQVSSKQERSVIEVT